MTTWNWSWVNSAETTNRASNSVDKSGGTLYVCRFASRGHISTTELRASIDSISTNINHLWRLWRSNIRPILDSLPSGKRDERWRTGRGLPEKIDALRYGIQGSTLFVFNDANSTKASGKYWHSTDERPITIAEAIEDLWDAINDLDITTTTTPTSVDLSPLWYAIGNRYEDASMSSAAGSLDYRTTIMEDWWTQLRQDLYEPSTYPPYTLGVALNYSVAQNIDLLLKAHGITGGWQEDPTGLGHGSFAPSAHTHPYDEITTTLAIGDTQGRVPPLSTLEDEVKRIRYELSAIRGGGASWYSDPVDPVTVLANGSLYQHMNYSGTGAQTSTNPHGITYTDIGIDVYLQYIANFIGMSDYTASEDPSYTSTNYISVGDNLTVAISILDDAIGNIDGFVFKRIIDFTGRTGSDTELEQTPLVWEHNMGEYPVLNFIDLSAESEAAFGMYSSPTVEVQIDYPNINTVRIWTVATDIRIIGLFGGYTGGPSPFATQYVRSIKAESSGTALYGDVTLIGGTNITLSRSGQNITINASGGGAGYWTESGTTLIPYVSTHKVHVGAGTEALPGLAFAADPDTGLFRVGSDQMGISIGANEVARYTSSVCGLYLPLNIDAADGCNLPGIQVNQADDTNYENGIIINRTSNYSSLFSNAFSLLLTGNTDQTIWTDKDLYIGRNSGFAEDKQAYAQFKESDTNDGGTIYLVAQPDTPASGGYASISLEGSDTSCMVKIFGEVIYFRDGSTSGSTWGAANGIALSASSTEWDDIETLIGSEGSIFGAILAAASPASGFTSGSILFASSGGTVTEDNTYMKYLPGSSATLTEHLIGVTSSNSIYKSEAPDGNAAIQLVAESANSSGGSSSVNIIASANVGETCTVEITSLSGSGIISANGHLRFDNSHRSGWSQSYLLLSDDSSDWADYKYLFGEVSLMAAIIAASGGSGGSTSLDGAYNIGSFITVDTAAVSMTVPDDTNINVLELTQNDTTNYGPYALKITKNSIPTGPGNVWSDAYSIFLTGYADQSIWTDKNLYIGKTGSGGGYVWLNLGQTASGGRGILSSRDSGSTHFGTIEVSSTSSLSYSFLSADEVRFLDVNNTDWTQQYILLSDDSSDWTDYKYLFGEVSLMAAIIAAASSGGSGSVSEPAGQIVYGTGTGVDSHADFSYSSTYDTLSIVNNYTTTYWYSSNSASIDLSGTATQGNVIKAAGNLIIGSLGSVADNKISIVARSTDSTDAYSPSILLRAEPTDAAVAASGQIDIEASYYGVGSGTINITAEGYGGEGGYGGIINIRAEEDVAGGADPELNLYTKSSSTDYGIEILPGIITIEECDMNFDTNKIYGLNNVAWGTPTGSIVSGSTLTVNFSTGKDAQKDNFSANITTLSITAPSNGYAKGLVIELYNNDASAHTVGGGTGWNGVTWSQFGTDLGSSSVSVAAGDTLIIMLIYNGSAWRGSYDMF